MELNIKIERLILIGIVFINGLFAYCQTTFAQEEGQVNETTIRASNWSSTYWGSFTRNRVVDSDSYLNNSSSFASTTNVLFLNYKISSTTLIGPIVGYEWAPIMTAKSHPYNPALRIANTEMIATRDFKLFSDLRFTIPLNWSQELQSQQVVFGIRTTQIATYRKLGSSFWVTSFNWFRWLWFNQVGLGKRAQFYSRSSMNYDLSRPVALSLVLLASVSENNSSISKVTLDSLRTGPGVQIKLMKDWTLAPYLTFNLLSPLLKDTGLYVITQAQLF